MTAIVLDCETTGFSAHEDRITEIAIIAFESDELLLHSYVNPEKLISEEITKITGITNETVRDAPKFSDLAGKISMLINEAEALIGYNPHFDRKMLCAEFSRSGNIVKFPRLICAKWIWDNFEPREQRHLTNAYKRFVDRTGFDGAHGALADTRACARVVKAQISEFNLHGKRWDEYDPEQARWWGPSNHVLWQNGILIFNVGKNKGVPCHQIDKGFWKWLVNQDFPDHVKELADYLTFVKPDIGPEDLATWAYGKQS